MKSLTQKAILREEIFASFYSEDIINERGQTVSKVCPNCNQIVETSESVCRNCGKKMMPVSRIKILGWLSLICGVFLIGLMSWLSIWMYQAISRSGQPGAGTFRGGPEMIALIIAIFGLLITFGIFAVASGLWQIIYGKRNKILNFAVILLGIIFIGMALLINFTK